jgi:hypothetical protein
MNTTFTHTQKADRRDPHGRERRGNKRTLVVSAAMLAAIVPAIAKTSAGASAELRGSRRSATPTLLAAGAAT